MLSTQSAAVRGLVVVRIFLVKRVDLTRMIRPTHKLYTQSIVMLTGVSKRKFDVGGSSVDITGLVPAKRSGKIIKRSGKIIKSRTRKIDIQGSIPFLNSSIRTTKKGNSKRAPTSEDKPGKCHTQAAAVDWSSPYQ